MPPDRGYQRARELLKRRFGDEYRIVSLWVSRLTEARNSSLREMADDARSCYEALETLDATSEMDTMGNLFKLVQKMPN